MMNRIRRIQGHRRDILLLAGLVLASLPLICLSAAQGTSAPPAELVLYVDAVNGSDSSSGSCPEEALRTLGAAAARINASPRPSNEIRVLPGTYSGAGNRGLGFGAFDVRIASTEGASSVEVDLEGGAFLSLSGMCSGAGCTVEGLTVSNGGGSGAAILASGMDLALRDCVLSGNSCSMGAVLVDGGRADVSGTAFFGNRASAGAGALNLSWSTGSAVADCDFLGNLGSAASSASLSGSSADFIRCRFAENGQEDAGGCAIRAESPYGSGAGNSCLTMHDCLVKTGSGGDPLAASGVWNSDGGEVELLNCTLTGGGVLLQSDGPTRLNNTIVDGLSDLTGETAADNTYSWDDLTGSGGGNLTGTSPGLDPDGGLVPGSPCIGAGNATDVSGTDLNGNPRGGDSTDVGCIASGSGTAAGNGPAAEGGAGKSPGESSSGADHRSAYSLRLSSPVTVTCSGLDLYSRDPMALLPGLQAQLSAFARMEGRCIVDGGGSGEGCTAKLMPVIAGFSGIPRPHPLLPGQAAPGSIVLDVRFGCAVSPQRTDLVPPVEDHRLGWTGTCPEDFGCAMEGLVPEDGRHVRRQSLRVPLGESLPMQAEWTGGTFPADGVPGGMPAIPCPYPVETGLGCRLLTHMACSACRKEWEVSPMPSWQHRCLMHHTCYFGPEFTDADDFNAALKQLGEIEFGAGWGPDAEALLCSSGAQYSNPEYRAECRETGPRNYTFRRVCLPYTVRPGDFTSRLACGNYTAGCEIKVDPCQPGEFTYEVTTVGVSGLTASPEEEKAGGDGRQAGSPGGGSGRQAAPLAQFTAGNTPETRRRCVLVPAAVRATANPGERPRRERAASSVVFRASPKDGDGTQEGGGWPQKEDYPYGAIPEWMETTWKFPVWNAARMASAASAASAVPNVINLRNIHNR